MQLSESFRRLKEQTQANFDFAVLVCTAVPQLKYALKEYATNKEYLVVRNAQFNPSAEEYSSEKRAIPRYKSVLGANFFLSSFSFFESYVFALVDEMVDFHGGADALLGYIEKRVKQGELTDTDKKKVQKLQKQHKPEHITRYQKFSKELNETNWVWPTDKLALYGMRQLLANRKKWKSVDIPDLLNHLFLFELSVEDVEKYHSFRYVRNTIAHGKKLSYDLSKSVVANQFLFDLAGELDKFVVQYFFVIERYR